MKRLLTLSIAAIFMSCTPSSNDEAIKLITKEKLNERVAKLSSDEFEGRAPSTNGGTKAIDYIVSEYKKIGLKPINGSYTQDLAMVKYGKIVKKSSVSIKNGRKNFKLRADLGKDDDNFGFWATDMKPTSDVKNAEIVYVGYGVEAPEHGWDDFKGMDVKGKILLMLNNDPQVMKDGKLDPDYFKGETRTYYGRWTYKFEQAMKHGAAGAILVHTTASAGYGYKILGSSGLETHYTVNLPGAGFQLPFAAHADSLLSNEIAKTVGKTLPEFFAMANRKDFQPIKTKLRLTSHIETEVSSVTTSNIYGVVEGTDPELKKQHIVFSAHYDHKGIHAGEDSIFNGAWDNASGTSSIMNLAEAYVKNPTKRSMIFLACAAEESGSLGSLYFAGKSPLPLNQIVADINIDMPNVHGKSRDIAVVGVNSNSIGDILKEEAKKVMVDGTPLLATDDPNPNAGLFYRSDQVNFAKKGIPALFVMSGVDYIGRDRSWSDEKNKEVYHQASDEIDKDWDLSGLVRDMKMIYSVGQRVGNNPEQPKWHSGNEFETPYNALYKK
jgi:Zn-dependent M28 family amino/carboxypeptidase